ncbi:TPA: hypothetical protein QDC22_003893 [Burkholderia stabilis]|nr:hypothetical protein [Burkholderia stabilis]HDR9650031.1 hypothetical protein [Burkholderia stabilis]HDR9657796.1 hypothetical protein [Burkholderia stabilis]HDR9680095.1 hypothetical protein [Burkholderia stabilis]
MARHASRAPQYAHLNARAKRRGTRLDVQRTAAWRTPAKRARDAGTGTAAQLPAFRPHPVADPVKLRVSAH